MSDPWDLTALNRLHAQQAQRRRRDDILQRQELLLRLAADLERRTQHLDDRERGLDGTAAMLDEWERTLERKREHVRQAAVAAGLFIAVAAAGWVLLLWTACVWGRAAS